MPDIENGYKEAKPLGFHVLHVCKKCFEPMGKDATKPHMVCGHCKTEWCWSCEWELDHWFHQYQGDEKIFCNILNDIYFGTDRFEYPPALRGVALFFIFALGPFIAVLIFSLIIICIFFVMLFSVIKISIRWHKENKKIKEDPHVVDLYQNIETFPSTFMADQASKQAQKFDRQASFMNRASNYSAASNKSGHTPDVEVIPGQNQEQTPAVIVPQAVKPGGTTASKKKLNKADFMFKSLQNQTLIKMPGQINGIDFQIKDLDNCIVIILDHTAQITVDRCMNTKFYIGPVKSSIFIRDSQKCEFTVSCSQFRCRDLKNSKIMLYTPNDPIIESSSNLTFGPFNMKYPYLEEHSGTEFANVIGKFTDDDGDVLEKRNQWNKIFDFTTKEGGNNYKTVSPQDFKMYQINSLFKEVKFDVPNKDWVYDLDEAFGGTLKESDQKERKDGLQAFDIKTGQAAAQQKVDQLQEQDPASLTTKQKMDLEIQKRMVQTGKPTVSTTNFGKKKLNRADYMFQNLHNQTLVKLPGQINGQQFKIKDLENCSIILLDFTAQVDVDRCNNCKFYIGPITASLFIRNCTGCEVTVACSQFRCRDLNESTVYLYSPNDPIIESSSNLTFAPWNLKYSKLDEQAKSAKIIGEFKDDEGTTMQKVNKWNQIFDFTTKESGNNFKLISASKFKVYNIKDIHPNLDMPQGNDSFIFELPIEFGGTLDISKIAEVKQNMHAFDIKTGTQIGNAATGAPGAEAEDDGNAVDHDDLNLDFS